jgi:hypothetical protein
MRNDAKYGIIEEQRTNPCATQARMFFASRTESNKILPPISHTFNLMPSLDNDLMLKPCVGMVWVMSSSDNCFSTLVLPALSSPRRRIRSSESLFLRLRRIWSKPIANYISGGLQAERQIRKGKCGGQIYIQIKCALDCELSGFSVRHDKA